MRRGKLRRERGGEAAREAAHSEGEAREATHEVRKPDCDVNYFAQRAPPLASPPECAASSAQLPQLPLVDRVTYPQLPHLPLIREQNGH